jgi:hypothetical protein
MAGEILAFRTSTYARNIYIFGITKFETIPVEYVQPVKQYGADMYTVQQISEAQTNGFITLEQCDETIALKEPADPQ